MGRATETRSQTKNKQMAFKRMAESKKFQAWHKLEVARRLGKLEEIEKEVARQMQPKNLKVEYY